MDITLAVFSGFQYFCFNVTDNGAGLCRTHQGTENYIATCNCLIIIFNQQFTNKNILVCNRKLIIYYVKRNST